MNYGEWLSEQRDRAGLSAEELADRAFCFANEIISFEIGEDFPLPELRKRIEEALKSALQSSYCAPSASQHCEHSGDLSPKLRQEFRKLSYEGKLKVLDFIRALDDVPRYWIN